ncbi:carbohydrate ABC transporter permease [Salisediminibacterium selenitireducens]|uniref:Binding-protein-dependent transport systems inner membrane component n=1 Tax=Bacillus selenitireducens (strain ATCC 700615 / DSM 15326 / MLS10) TaxID=439292 RepID=D6XWN4_BACIE|nr:sugar ABC transporter permease [Salisediminibacterium selenitireducens]ADH97876.1 binding-protein-dependent transport systems inner membrane component [[Bacillus] selenitireducens MLS10]
MASVDQNQQKQTNGFFKFLYSKKAAPYIFVSPFIISFLLLFLYPMISAVNMSFQRVLPGQIDYIGLHNYSRVFNPTFYTALQNTTIYVVWTVILLTFIPLIFAVFLNHRLMKFTNFFRAAIFIPALTSVIVAGTIFRMIFGDSDSAFANQVLQLIGLDTVEWRYGAGSGMFLMVALASWRWMGVNILYYLAALQNVNYDLYEAADIDGAGVWQKFRHVTFPAIKPVVIFLSTITMINGFRMFEESFVFWETSSPGNIGLTVVGYIYVEGIQRNDMGFGAAVGVVLLIIILVVSIIQLILTGAFKKDD